MEPISPELVLVDPELGRIERARLAERARLDAIELAQAEPVLDIATPRHIAETPVQRLASEIATPHWRDAIQRRSGRLVQVLLLLSLFANGVLVAVEITKGSGVSASQAAPAPVLSGNTSVVPSTPVAQRFVPRSPAAVNTSPAKATVEQKVIMRLLQSSAGNRPPELTDRTTGLLKSGLQVSCHRAKAAGSFLCAFRVPGAASGNTLTLRYRVDRSGRDRFTWSRVRQKSPGSHP